MSSRLSLSPRNARIMKIAVGSVFLAFALMLAYIYYREKPRIQIVGQSMGSIATVLHLYIEEHGLMPSEIEDLVTAGLIERVPPCRPRGLNDERATTEYRLAIWDNDHPIYYWNDLVVNWGVSVQELQVRDGKLFNRRTGESDFIIGRRDLFNPDRTVDHLGLSIMLLEALTQQQESQ